MSWYLVQAGSNLYKVDTAGTATALTLPDGVTIDSTKRLRMALMETGENEHVIAAVNSPSINLWIDKEGRCRPLCLNPISGRPVLTSTGSGQLSGSYQVAVTNAFRDVNGRLVQESPFGPISAASATLSSSNLVITAVDISMLDLDSTPIGIPGQRLRRIYRTTAGPGSVFYPWLEIEFQDNNAPSIADDLTDASLALVSSVDSLGNPAGTRTGTYLADIVEWGSRFWAVPSTNFDSIVYCEERAFSKWPATNDILIPPHQDTTGVTAFLPRRDMLGVARQDSIDQVTIVNGVPRRVRIAENIGVIAKESVAVIADRAYFLSFDGVYVWGPGGIENISRSKVHPWFTTNTYFNRAVFNNAIGWWDPEKDMYRLLLAPAGSSSLTRWISYHIPSGAWFGPHSTSDVTPTGVALLRDSSGRPLPTLTTSNGYLMSMNRATRTDGASTAIASTLETKYFIGDDPATMTFFGLPEILTNVEGSGTMTITPKVGELAASYGTGISHALTNGRTRLNFRGVGRFLQLKFEQATNAVDATIQGIEIPFHTVGRR